MNTVSESGIAFDNSTVEPPPGGRSGSAAVNEGPVAGDTAGGGAAEGDVGGESPVNYEEAALLELALDDTDYRLDVGRAGTALCISTRPSGSWAWVFRGEAKWQANTLRCRAFDREVLTRLSRALAEAAADSQS